MELIKINTEQIGVFSRFIFKFITTLNTQIMRNGKRSSDSAIEQSYLQSSKQFNQFRFIWKLIDL